MKDYAGPDVEDHIRDAANAGLASPESEQAVIAAALCAPDACEDAFDRLEPTTFADGLHGRIWGAARGLHRQGRPCAPALIRDALGVDEGFERWGGISRLQDLSDLGTTRGLTAHVNAVADRASRRAIRGLVNNIGERVLDTADADAVEILSALEQGAAKIAHGSTAADQWITGGDMIGDAIAYARSRSGLIEFPFGIPEVDSFIGGMNRGEATLLAARPGMGKTVGAQTVVRTNAAGGKGTCFFSLEMAAHPLGLRLASDIAYDRRAPMYSGLSSNPTADGAMKNLLTTSQWDRLQEAQAIVGGWPMLIDTRAGLTLAQIEATTRRQHRKWERQGIEPGPVVIDHLGKVRPSVDRRGNKHAEMADISNGVSEMAKRLGVPVLALVQLNRGVEGRDDKRPQLSDLRQAGELEEDARQVIFLFRPEYYLRDGPPNETFEKQTERMEELRSVEKKLYWIVEKNSHGARGQVLTFCDIASSAIRGWDI